MMSPHWSPLRGVSYTVFPDVSNTRPLCSALWSPLPLSLPVSPSTEATSTVMRTYGFDGAFVRWQIVTLCGSGGVAVADVALPLRNVAMTATTLAQANTLRNMLPPSPDGTEATARRTPRAEKDGCWSSGFATPIAVYVDPATEVAPLQRRVYRRAAA